ncbi:MAG: PAS domain S-box protein [Negativicutes bacterium]|nr:PAS domain S-box protein [Negativicutes bacterium]
MKSPNLSYLTALFKGRLLSGYSRLIFMLGILLIAGLWLFVFYQTNRDYERTMEESSQETMNLTIAFEEHVRSILSEADKDLLKLRQVYEREGVSSPITIALLEIMGNDPTRSQVSINSPQGIVLASFDKRGLGNNISDRAYFQAQRDATSDTLDIGKPVIARANQQATIPLTRRINNPDGSFGGIVFVGIKTDYFLDFYKKIDLGENQLISLIGTDGFIRARQSGRQFETGQDLRGSIIWQSIQAGHPYGTYTASSMVDGINRIFSFRAMPDYPLIISVSKTTQAALASFEQRRRSYLFGALLISLFIAAFCGLLVNRQKKLLVQNEALQAQEEELQTQNEELRAQEEELQAQNEELRAQEEALSTVNIQLVVSNEVVAAEKERLSSLINSISDEVWFVDTAKNFTLANPAALREFNLGANQTAVEDLAAALEVLRPDGSPRPVEEAWPLLALQGKVIKNGQEIVRTPATGELRYRAVSANPVRDVDGNIIGAVAVVRDTTEHRKIEQEQLTALLKLEAALGSMTDAVFISDAEGRFIEFNDAFATFHRFGNKTECLRTLGEYPDILTVFLADGKPAPMDQWAVPRALRGETVTNAEYILQRKDTGESWVGSYSFAPIRSKEGVITGAVIVARDITGRKQIEDELSESRERYRALVQQSSDAIVLCEFPSMKIVEANAAAAKMFGYSEADLVTLNLADFRAVNEDKVDVVRQTLAESKILLPEVRQYRHKNGHIVYSEQAASLIEVHSQQLAIFTYRDITAARKFQEEIQAEVELAGKVQKAMLPGDYSGEKATIRTIYEPLHLVSGDYYGYKWSKDGEVLNGYILDITGHGMATALQTAAVSAVLGEELGKERIWTAQTLERLNLHMSAYLPDESFAAILTFSLDFRSKQLTLIGGGINYYLGSTYNSNDWGVLSGYYLGISETANFGVATFPLQYGDTFYFLTDGIADLIKRDEPMLVHDFTATIETLRQVADSPEKFDDCLALCLQIKGLDPYPVSFEYAKPDDRTRIRPRVLTVLTEIAGAANTAVEIAIGEAITNGLEHGTKVNIKVNKIGERLVVRVRDNGSGFNGNAAIAAIQAAGIHETFLVQLWEERGRGLPMMLKFMDRVIYNKAGNEVLLVKQL